MKESFYYFFSATPQVLGAILALFAVFVIFKIKTIRDQLIGISRSVYIKWDDLKSHVNVNFIKDYDKILDDINNAIQREDIDGLKKIIDKINHKDFMIYQERYNGTYIFRQKLIIRTKLLSVFTAAIIILCLSVIPFGTYILNHIFLLYYLYFVVIDGTFICLFVLIYVLDKSIKEIRYDI